MVPRNTPRHTKIRIAPRAPWQAIRNSGTQLAHSGLTRVRFYAGPPCMKTDRPSVVDQEAGSNRIALGFDSDRVICVFREAFCKETNQERQWKSMWNSRRRIGVKISDAGTVYNFYTIDVDGKPEVQFKSLKRLVGERGFEPPTPWSRTRCSTRLSHSPTAPRKAARGTKGACSPLIRYEIITRFSTALDMAAGAGLRASRNISQRETESLRRLVLVSFSDPPFCRLVLREQLFRAAARAQPVDVCLKTSLRIPYLSVRSS
jgi:hypothetical protein